VPLLRELERQGVEGKLVNADVLCRQATDEFERIRRYLESYLATHALLASKA
jgi:hypothetical protein